ncbi:PAS domain S-box protein [Piscinibacter sp. Jin2]|uniref:PAS domain S-box protein n=1 Tax=Aquariibacter lacus TaxID=2801332 RepID=A0A9X0XFC5_9BURK|nr:LuxR C-terminal-related transcriptional regulator [Piscinibacter lacus]MBL0720561.1 PAS domain S-box protein [Piscinibacter lacus]
MPHSPAPPLPPGACATDYRTAFALAPVGLVISRERRMVDCNQAFCRIFRTHRELLIGQSFALLYPSHEEFERTGARIVARLDAEGHYADDRVMKRSPSDPRGELFWCHVAGQALNPAAPHEAGLWSFEDLSDKRAVAPLAADGRGALTAREREVAALLIEGQRSKQIGRQLGLSPRTVDVYRGRLLRKLSAASTTELVQKLLAAG